VGMKWRKSAKPPAGGGPSPALGQRVRQQQHCQSGSCFGHGPFLVMVPTPIADDHRHGHRREPTCLRRSPCTYTTTPNPTTAVPAPRPLPRGVHARRRCSLQHPEYQHTVSPLATFTAAVGLSRQKNHPKRGPFTITATSNADKEETGQVQLLPSIPVFESRLRRNCHAGHR